MKWLDKIKRQYLSTLDDDDDIFEDDYIEDENEDKDKDEDEKGSEDASENDSDDVHDIYNLLDEFDSLDEDNFDDIVKLLHGSKFSTLRDKDFWFYNKILTLPIIIIGILGIFSAVIGAIAAESPAVADFFTDNISFAMRFVLTNVTYYIPFSLAELILYISVPAAVYLLARFVYKIAAGKEKRLIMVLRSFTRFAAFALAIAFIFNFTFSVCYSSTPAYQKIGFERRLIKSEDLSGAMQMLIDMANKSAQSIERTYTTGSTVMPYSLREMNEKLNEAYTNLFSRHDITKQIRARVKPVILSVKMSEMHITGIYSPFTGEANLNVDFPDYSLPFTAAHEMAHLMGIAREDEANFIAFLVCLYSDDDYIKYSGMVNMIEYLQNPLYQADEYIYYQLIYSLDTVILKEMAAYRTFFDKYRNTEISKVASAVNDIYLKSQKQEAGEKSYGLVVDLATIYMLEIYEK